MMPRVMFLTYVNPDRLPPLMNSAEILAGAGIGVDILVLDSGEQWVNPQHAAIRRFYVPNPSDISVSPVRASIRFLLFLFAAIRQARQRYYPLLVAHDPHSLVVAHVMHQFSGGTVCYHCHELTLPSELCGLRLLFKRLEYFFLRRTPFWIVPDRVRGQLIADASGTQHPPFVVANCARLISRNRPSRLVDAMADRGRRFSRIVFRQGILGPGHAVEQTIRSIGLWRDSSWGLVLMGFAAPMFLREMHNLARALLVSDRVVFLPPVAYVNVLDYTRGADVGLAIYEEISLSHRLSGTASNKLFEYVSVGVPVIANHNPLLRSVVLENGIGALANPSDPRSIAHAINEVLGDQRCHSAMSRRALRIASSEYNYDAQYAPVLARIKQLVSSFER
jgi:glycosyltransferase involved in cell wall biosynthesis